MRAEVVSLTSESWTTALSQTERDVYTLPGWSVATSLIEGGEAASVIVSAELATCIAPFLQRAIDDSGDHRSPYLRRVGSLGTRYQAALRSIRTFNP